MMKLSVLMSVYHKESAEFLGQCLDSLAAQTVQADEIVVVKDGPLGKGLDGRIDSYGGSLPITTLQLHENAGLGWALRQGLAQCRGELVARMDADDICIRERFEKQLAFLEQNPPADVVGGAIAEFHTDCMKTESIRRMPSSSEEVSKVARRRNPLNHMTVMFRKASVLAAGSYRPCVGFEDYDLWARMLMGGRRLCNLHDVLVHVRSGNGMYQRRGGLRYLGEEINLQWRFLKAGFLSKRQFAINLVTRAPVRVMPVAVRAAFYRQVLRQR